MVRGDVPARLPVCCTHREEVNVKNLSSGFLMLNAKGIFNAASPTVPAKNHQTP